jgi:ESF2/ABP1 family protein
MTTRTHNEFLDIAPSDDESASDRGYDSEENVAKSKGRAVKRRRTANTQDFFGVESDNDESADENDEEEERDVKGKQSKQSKTTQSASDDAEEDEDEDDEGGAFLDTSKPTKPVKPLSTKPLKESKKNKTGVVYLSSLPPYLKPFALKNMIEKRNFGPVTKVFLSPRMPNNSGPTRKSNSRQLYNDGWLEFQSVSPQSIIFERTRLTP